MTHTGRCEACEVLMINGVRCHETGCPQAYKDRVVECFECGQEFMQESRYQRYCADCLDAEAP